MHLVMKYNMPVTKQNIKWEMKEIFDRTKIRKARDQELSYIPTKPSNYISWSLKTVFPSMSISH